MQRTPIQVLTTLAAVLFTRSKETLYHVTRKASESEELLIKVFFIILSTTHLIEALSNGSS